MKTLNELSYGMAPGHMGTTGLVNYVRGPHWPLVPESTCFAARMEHATGIIASRHGKAGARAAQLFRRAVHAGR